MSAPSLVRQLGLPSAVMLGLGSILGTGVFVSIGLGAGLAEDSLPSALVLAALLAGANGLSSAQLAAAHPVSGGTYEYGHTFLGPRRGFIAGVTFLLAKSASAATAALGVAQYLGTPTWVAPVLVALASLLVAAGLKRSVRANAVMLAITISGLLLVIALGLFTKATHVPTHPSTGNYLEAVALMFVAFTGYGRIATLGEEVREPARTIPRAIMLTLAASGIIYVGVALSGLKVLGASSLYSLAATGGAPLEAIAQAQGGPFAAAWLRIAAITAMLGVLLNLLLGLSRVALAMARRGDLPQGLMILDAKREPVRAVFAVSALILFITLSGNVRLAWSFSAFTVLIYYALTNLAALALPERYRRFPRLLAWLGLLASTGLAFFVPVRVWLSGAAGLGFMLLVREAWIRRRP